MLENNNIKYKTEITGFLVTMINIPKNIEIRANKSKKPNQNPLNRSSKTKRFILKFFFFSYKKCLVL